MTILIRGTLHEMSENIRTVTFPNGDTRVTNMTIETDDYTLIPIEVWGDRKIDFAKANIGRKADFVCTLAGTHSKFTNHDGDEAEISYCRLKLKKMLLDYAEGNAND